MSLRKLKLLEIAIYVAASVTAFFFRMQTGYQRFGSYPVRDVLDTFIAPYGIFIVLTLLLHLSKSIHLAVVSLVASAFVFVGTLVSYTYILSIEQCGPCWVFFGNSIFLLVGWCALLIVGVVVVRFYSRWRKIGV